PDSRAGRTQFQTRTAVAGALAKLTSTPGASPEEAVAWLPPSHTVPGAPATAGGGASIADAIAAVFGRADAGSPLSWPLLFMALALALAEVFLARRASHAEVLAS